MKLSEFKVGDVITRRDFEDDLVATPTTLKRLKACYNSQLQVPSWRSNDIMKVTRDGEVIFERIPEEMEKS